ncbi:cupin domain-containing protein [bacterium]|nr:cupin domain-containing protein [bacterium]
MKKYIFSLVMLFLLGAFNGSFAQTLDGNPYTPGKDANIDLYICSWKDSEPHTAHGALIERDILTRGNPLNPPEKGAVLTYINLFTHATLEPGTSITPTTLKGEQEINYILTGKGAMKGRKTGTDLYPGIAVLIPAECPFTMSSTGDEPLTMYLINEPVPPGFRPNKDILVRDENTQRISSTDVHWCHIARGLFGTADGLGTLESIITVSFDPMTIGHPHSHIEGCEEVWTAIRGESIAFLGKQIRMQPEGTGYMIPADGKTPHANINTGEETVKMLYFARYRDHEVRK